MPGSPGEPESATWALADRADFPDAWPGAGRSRTRLPYNLPVPVGWRPAVPDARELVGAGETA
ncbi:hypothetical protein ACIBH1_48720 [Nonomuraea sp. NPDC050663]|uniref:hypothetical protein n=1 Tax=Nonomuraea sp. NPDC050663 TaxID=3364370 RepID=UPI00379B27C6